jgi:hypothetical protein
VETKSWSVFHGDIFQPSLIFKVVSKSLSGLSGLTHKYEDSLKMLALDIDLIYALKVSAARRLYYKTF